VFSAGVVQKDDDRRSVPGTTRTPALSFVAVCGANSYHSSVPYRSLTSITDPFHPMRSISGSSSVNESLAESFASDGATRRADAADETVERVPTTGESAHQGAHTGPEETSTAHMNTAILLPGNNDTGRDSPVGPS